AVSPAVSDAEPSARPTWRVGWILRKTSPSRLLLRRRASATVARGQGLVNVPSTEVSRDQTLPAVGRGPSPRPPRLHPGITQKIAPNESQRGPKSLMS